MLLALGAILTAFLLTTTVYPYTQASIQGGRVYRLTATVYLSKADDDPWGSYAPRIFPVPPNIYTEYWVLRTNPNVWPEFSVTQIATSDPQLNLLTEVRILVTFTVSTANTYSVRLSTDGGWNVIIAEIPSIQLNPGAVYRWSFTIPYYSSNNLKITAFPIPAGSRQFFTDAPVWAECSYSSGGEWVTDGTGLTVSVVRGSPNATHNSVYFRITFGSAWAGRFVNRCYWFTTHTSVLNPLNSFLQAQGQPTLSRLNYVIADNLNLVVASGDVLEVLLVYVIYSAL